MQPSYEGCGITRKERAQRGWVSRRMSSRDSRFMHFIFSWTLIRRRTAWPTGVILNLWSGIIFDHGFGHRALFFLPSPFYSASPSGLERPFWATPCALEGRWWERFEHRDRQTMETSFWVVELLILFLVKSRRVIFLNANNFWMDNFNFSICYLILSRKYKNFL